MSKINAALKLARLPVAKKIEKARYIVASMTGNPAFATPIPTLASITTAINALEAAQLAALGGSVEETAAMHVKEEALELQLKLLAAYVTGIAAVNPATAEAVILSAGMELRASGGRRVVDFALESLKEAGRIKVMVAYVQRSTFVFQMSVNPTDERNWETIYEGTRARIIRSGLVSGTRYYFRVAVINKNGRGPWTDPMSAIAL